MTALEQRLKKIEALANERQAAKAFSQREDDGVSWQLARLIVNPGAPFGNHAIPYLWPLLNSILEDGFEGDERYPGWLYTAIASHFGRFAISYICPSEALLHCQQIWSHHGFTPEQILDRVNADHWLQCLNRFRYLAFGPTAELQRLQGKGYYWYGDTHQTVDQLRSCIDAHRREFADFAEVA